MKTKVNTFLVIRVLNILVSLFIFVWYYTLMLNSSPSSRGFAEFFTMISAGLLISSGLGFSSIFITLKKTPTQVKLLLILYFLVPILSMGLQNYFTVIGLFIISFFVWLFALAQLREEKFEPSNIFVGILLATNLAWVIFSVKNIF